VRITRHGKETLQFLTIDILLGQVRMHTVGALWDYSGKAPVVELVRLADDVSNDFVQVSIARVAECAEVAQWDETSSRCGAAPQELIRGFVTVLSSALAVSSGQDLLRLLSVQRK